jgi:hypothetical protein
VASDDDEAGAMVFSDEDAADEAAAEDDGAGAAEDELTAGAELELGVAGGVGAPPRLKIQIRPMITITATMMIIQVLRFMGIALGLRRVDWEEFCRSA